jgi:hypothetical protein
MHSPRRTRVVCVAAAVLAAGSACASVPSGSARSDAARASRSASSAASASATSPAPSSGSATPSPTATAAELPRGGRELLPTYRLVGFSGGPGTAAFGRLGVGDLDARGREIEKRAAALAGGREPLPVFELITVVAHGTPGRNRLYNSRVGDDVIARYLAAARRHRGLLLLNIQPGREDFLPIVQALRPWLEQPDVGIALDPEWAVEPGDVPGQRFGRTTGKELDSVAAYLDHLVRSKSLPQKAMVFHQVAARVVVGQSAIKERPGVVVFKSVDGIGSMAAKLATWRVLVKGLPPSVHTGFKLFFDEDVRHGRLMTPAQILALRPQPEYVLYE